jgi:hypothetical protein
VVHSIRALCYSGCWGLFLAGAVVSTSVRLRTILPPPSRFTQPTLLQPGFGYPFLTLLMFSRVISVSRVPVSFLPCPTSARVKPFVVSCVHIYIFHPYSTLFLSLPSTLTLLLPSFAARQNLVKKKIYLFLLHPQSFPTGLSSHPSSTVTPISKDPSLTGPSTPYFTQHPFHCVTLLLVFFYSPLSLV